jgi:tetratricopeptide (TPR) repeat protein
MSDLGMTTASRPPMTAGGNVHMKLADALKQAQTLFGRRQFDQAEKLATAILRKHPNHVEATQILAGVAEARGQHARAIEILQRSLTGANTDALALTNLCRLLRVQGRLEESRAMGERAVALGTLLAALVDLADTNQALGEHERAFELYEEAVAKQPQLARARMGLAQALLRRGEFRAGWTEYEWRYQLLSTRNLLPRFKQPQWNGMPLKSSRLLIIAEQGYGDCFQFARYLPLVHERVKDVILGCGAEIRSLLENLPGMSTCYDRWENLPAFDFQITMSSLPLVFGTMVETIPSKVPYLHADPTKTAAWRARLGEQAQGRKTVGIAWQGRPTHPNDRVRSLALGHMTRLLELDGILPVSLQAGQGREQLAQHPAGMRVVDAAQGFKDFGDTAACISALDCVVSIDSAIAHLTGALGKPGFVMLPKAAEWRWMDDRADSPWYPSLQLIRQDINGAWDGVVTRVIERLRA